MQKVSKIAYGRNNGVLANKCEKENYKIWEEMRKKVDSKASRFTTLVSNYFPQARTKS